MRSKERENEQIEQESKSESGYSEKRQAIDIESRSGDLQMLKRSKGMQNLSAVNKKLTAYQSVTKKLFESIGMYINQKAVNPHRAQSILSEIIELKELQEGLFIELIDRQENKQNVNLTI